MDNVDGLIGRLRKLLDDATPGDLAAAERHTENETVECPLCHEGEVEASDYCNIDGKALGVQFYGIGKEFGAHERLWSETLAALPDLLTTLETLTQENARLRESGWRDIKSAPDDGSFVLVIGGRHIIASVEKADGGWWRMAQHDGLQSAPTHWMLLPPAPAKSDLEAK